MIIRKLQVGELCANCYILMDEDTCESVIIDPGGHANKIIKEAESLNSKIKYILLTHGHKDHASGAFDLAKNYNVPIYINKLDFDIRNEEDYFFKGSAEDEEKWVVFLNEGETIKIGGTDINVIGTPGHTPGGLSFYTLNTLISGDTLFKYSVGRTDLGNYGNWELLINSIKEKLFTLSDNVIVYPGHGPETQIGNEKKRNPYARVGKSI